MGTKIKEKSDKRSFNLFHDYDTILGDLEDFSMASPLDPMGAGLFGADRLFSRFTREEVEELLAEAGITGHLASLGFKHPKIDLEILSPYDNRIYLRHRDKVLVHMRLKFQRTQLKPTSANGLVPDRNFELIFIDWLLSQDPRGKTKRGRQKLFPGQKYPGLGIYREVRSFISLLGNRLQCDGALNAPEYFHDAVLFHDRFNFVDPFKEGLLQALLKYRKSKEGLVGPLSLRDLSWAIFEHRLLVRVAGDVRSMLPPGEQIADGWQVLAWPYGEMVSPLNVDLKHYFASDEYKKTVAKVKDSIEFGIVPLP